MPHWLEIFGRYSLDYHRSGIDNDGMWQRVGPLYEYSSSDPEGFLAELKAVVAGDQGGFATFGAARLVWELFGGDSLRTASALPLIDAGIQFIRARGVSGLMLTGYEKQRLAQILEQEENLIDPEPS